ncbi:MAG: 2-dehydro-3-deoxygalactonokinase [Pseudomonadota bacterium]
MHQQLVGIDWGTSNRRAYLIDRDGACLATQEDNQGMLAARGRFAESLAELLARMQVGAGVPVLMSGMVGSASGWREVPYLDTGVALDALPAHLVRVDNHDLGRDCFIVPGYCQREGGIDVMRGEETQLFGAMALGRRTGWVVLPGTHSKWVLLRDGVIENISTYMTGELFASLAAQGTLAPLMADGDDDAAFDAGVAEAWLRAPLTNSLFRVRARVVSGAMPAAHARGFISGLLIGTEFMAAIDAGDGAPSSVSLIASAALHQRYVRAAALFGIDATQLDPHRVYLAALSQFLSKAAI